MKKLIPRTTNFILTYGKGISQNRKWIDTVITIVAWLIWGKLSHTVIINYLTYGPSHFDDFFEVLRNSFEVALIVAGILIVTGLYNVHLLFRDNKHSPDLGITLPLEKTASYFELDEESAKIARKEKQVDVEVDEFGKVIKVSKHQSSKGRQTDNSIH